MQIKTIIVSRTSWHSRCRQNECEHYLMYWSAVSHFISGHVLISYVMCWSAISCVDQLFHVWSVVMYWSATVSYGNQQLCWVSISYVMFGQWSCVGQLSQVAIGCFMWFSAVSCVGQLHHVLISCVMNDHTALFHLALVLAVHSMSQKTDTTISYSILETWGHSMFLLRVLAATSWLILASIGEWIWCIQFQWIHDLLYIVSLYVCLFCASFNHFHVTFYST